MPINQSTAHGLLKWHNCFPTAQICVAVELMPLARVWFRRVAGVLALEIECWPWQYCEASLVAFFKQANAADPPCRGRRTFGVRVSNPSRQIGAALDVELELPPSGEDMSPGK